MIKRNEKEEMIRGSQGGMKFLKILLFMIFFEIMSTQVYAAELELEPETYRNDNPYQFEISYTWTSEGETIKSYDVSKQGQIAIAFSNYTIGVFDHDMNFLYQLSFKTYGSYGVLWLDEKLVFIEVRSETAIVCDEDGMPEAFYKITGPRNYINDVMDKRLRKQGDYQYLCTNGSGGDNTLVSYGFYTILKRTSKEGEEDILYEADALLDGAFIARVAMFGFLLMSMLPFAGILAIWILTRRVNNNA